MPRDDAAMESVYVGTAGWSYDDWDGIVYPAGKPSRFDPLAYLARFFDCIEINNTFYRIPTARASESWVRRVSGNEKFRFSLKLYRGFTHEAGRALRGDAEAFRRGVAPLIRAGRLGCVLVQFPWSFKNVAENRSYLEKLFGEFEDLPLVLEVRHSSWNVASFYEFLYERRVGFCNIDQPLFRGSMKPTSKSTSSIGYFRLHGQNYEDWFREGAGRDDRYNYLYTEKELEPWAKRIVALKESLTSIYVITNNHYKGQAVCNALQLKARLTGEPVAVPPPLLNTYPQLEKIATPPSGQGDLFGNS